MACVGGVVVLKKACRPQPDLNKNSGVYMSLGRVVQYLQKVYPDTGKSIRNKGGIAVKEVLIVLVAVIVALHAAAQSTNGARPEIKRKEKEAVFRISGGVICILKNLESPYWAETPVRMSNDGKAIIFSADQYIFLSDIEACRGRKISARSIARVDGALVDINVGKNIYLSLDVMSRSPLLFLASFSRLDGRGFNFHPHGVWMKSKKMNRENAFNGVDEANPKGKISLNGRYISAADIPNCSEFAYPGVWDLAKARTVLIEEGSSEEIRKKCEALFSMP